jgi:hypothetical protein
MTTSLRGTSQSDLPTAPFGSGGTSSLDSETDSVETWRCSGSMEDADDGCMAVLHDGQWNAKGPSKFI